MIVGGSVVAAHGIDTIQSGIRQAASGEQVDSFTSMGLQAAGMSNGTANLVDAGISVVGSLGAGGVSATTKVAAIAATEEAAGMTTTQIIIGVEQGSRALPDATFRHRRAVNLRAPKSSRDAAGHRSSFRVSKRPQGGSIGVDRINAARRYCCGCPRCGRRHCHRHIRLQLRPMIAPMEQ